MISHHSQPDFGRQIPSVETVSLRGFLLLGLLFTAAVALPAEYAANSRFHFLKNIFTPVNSAPLIAETASNGINYNLRQAIGEGWTVQRCGSKWSERVKIVFLSSTVPNARLGFDKDGNKIEVAVDGLNGQAKVCSIERMGR